MAWQLPAQLQLQPYGDNNWLRKTAVVAAASLAAVYVLHKVVKWWNLRLLLQTYAGPEFAFPMG